MKTALAIIAALVVLAGGWWYYSTQMPGSSATSTPQTTQNTTDNTTGSNSNGNQGSTTVNINIDASVNDAPTTATVSLGSSGFSPRSVTIKKGGTVTWTNAGSGEMWVATASHPTHTVYSNTTLEQHCDDATDTAFDQCENGDSYSFKFDKTGTWNYHNHSNSSQFGSVVVVE